MSNAKVNMFNDNYDGIVMMPMVIMIGRMVSVRSRRQEWHNVWHILAVEKNVGYTHTRQITAASGQHILQLGFV